MGDNPSLEPPEPSFVTVTARYKAFLEELFSEFGPIRIRSMFGGAGVYADEAMFAIVADETLYLKADANSARSFAAEGKRPFAYRVKGRDPIVMSYWEVPERLLDDPAEFADWARQAHAIASAAKTKPRRGLKKRC